MDRNRELSNAMFCPFFFCYEGWLVEAHAVRVAVDDTGLGERCCAARESDGALCWCRAAHAPL